MKRGGKRGRRATRTLGRDFVRGFVATGLLAAVQDRAARHGSHDSRAEAQRVLRLALQGGAALAAGTEAATALQQRDWTRAMTVTAVGALGVLAIERLMTTETFREMNNEQEEA